MISQDLTVSENTHDKVGSHRDLAMLIQNSKTEILKRWEERMRKDLLSAQEMTSHDLQDTMPTFLDFLSKRLLDAQSVPDQEMDQLAICHGDHRSKTPNYNLSQVILEYRTLRTIIFEVIEARAPWTWANANARQILLDIFDQAIERSTIEFTEHRAFDLKRSNQELEYFAAIAAHDLKSPLATMQGYIDLIREELRSPIADEETLLKPLGVLQRSVSRMSGMINSLLEYSNLEIKMKPFEPVSIQEAIERATESLQMAIDESRAKIIYTDPMPCILGDLSLLTQLFLNIFNNSIKFRSEDDPFIYVQVHKTDGYWKFTVDDNGIGFDQSQAEKMFEIFKQLSPKHKTKGSGIGLALCRKVVSLHGGKIWAEAKKDRGARIHFTLPESQMQ